MAGRLAGKVAIVTGAGSAGPGVRNGQAAAILFAREGARVLCVDREAERAAATCTAIANDGGVASPFTADVTQRADCERMVAAALEHYGQVNILHNNVGIVSGQGIRDVTTDDWDRVMAVNLRSMVLAVQAALPVLEAAAGASIINLSSVAGLRSVGPLTAYATSKAGVIGLTISLAGQLAEKRIRVNCIAPGQVWTPLVAGLLQPTAREHRRLAGLIQEEGTAWDVAWAAVYLASDEARWITGQTLVVDAGLTRTTRDGDRLFETRGTG